MYHLFWENTLFKDALGYDNVQITDADDGTESHIFCSSKDEDKPNFFILIFYNCNFFSEKESARFKTFQLQMATEKNIKIGFWLIEDCNYDDAIILSSTLITKIIKLLDENNQYHFLGLVAIEFNESQKSWLSSAEIQNLISDSFSFEGTDLLLTLKKCPFLIRYNENKFRFSFSEFENYYIGLEFNKFNNSNFKGKFRNPINSFVIHYINFEALPLSALPLKELWGKFEIKKQEIIKNLKYESAAKLRDFQLSYFHKFIQPYWYDFDIIHLKRDILQLELELSQI